MNKTIQTLVLTAMVAVTTAQTNKWGNTGDNFNGNNWLGTTGNEPLILKANNTTGLKIRPNGDLVIKSLDLNTTTNGLILTDGQGKVNRLDFTGNASQILLGNGTWATMPAALNMLTVNGLNMNTPKSSKLGIGVANPLAELDVDGNTNIRGSLTVNNGLNFSGNNGFKFVAGQSSGGTFSYGKTTGAVVPVIVPCAAQPLGFYNHQFGGTLQIFDADANGNYTAGSGLLNIQAFTNGGSSIDASVGGNTQGGGLFINYFCGNNTYINNGTNGGSIYMGTKVYAAQSLKIGNDGTTTNSIDPNTPLAVYYNGTGGDAFTITNVSTNKINFKVKADGVVYSRELNVQLTAFPDYVFKKEYKLMSLAQLELYIQVNKHLPKVPTAETIEKEGANLGELSKLQMEKIEELTLYVIELKKEIDALKKTINK
jgi:hypothetical protein